MTNEIYLFNNYKEFLKKYLEGRLKKGHGVRREWAKVLGCHTTFISHVLVRDAHLSQEQAIRLAGHLDLQMKERRFFLMQLNWTRANSIELRKFYESEMEAFRVEMRQIEKRIQAESPLEEEIHKIYYGSWIYSAAHVAMSVPELQDLQRLSGVLHLTHEKAAALIRELLKMGLIEKLNSSTGSAAKFRVTRKAIHIDKSSSLLRTYLAQWKLQAVASISSQDLKTPLHFSSVAALSRKDVLQVREIMLRTIEQIRHKVKSSTEETVWCYGLDWFPVAEP